MGGEARRHPRGLCVCVCVCVCRRHFCDSSTFGLAQMHRLFPMRTGVGTWPRCFTTARPDKTVGGGGGGAIDPQPPPPWPVYNSTVRGGARGLCIGFYCTHFSKGPHLSLSLSLSVSLTLSLETVAPLHLIGLSWPSLGTSQFSGMLKGPIRYDEAYQPDQLGATKDNWFIAFHLNFVKNCFASHLRLCAQSSLLYRGRF